MSPAQGSTTDSAYGHVGFFAEANAAFFATAFHPAGRIDRIAPQIEQELSPANNLNHLMMVKIASVLLK